MKKLKTIDIYAKEWFDKINGNSYFAGRITIDYGMATEKAFIMHFQYGSHYEQEARNILIENKIIPSDAIGLNGYCKENNIIFRSFSQTKCKKSELKQF